MDPKIYFAVTGQLVVKHPNAIKKLECTINAGANASYFVQIHDSAVVPAEDAVPLKSWPIAECAYKEFKNGELRVSKGLYICISSTLDTKTLAIGGSDLFDALEVELYQPDAPTGTSFAGDETSNTPSANPWSSGTAHRLIEIVVNDAEDILSGEVPDPGNVFCLVFANDSAPSIDTPWFSALVTKGERNVFSFGQAGKEVVRTLSGTLTNGCLIMLSTSQDSDDILTTGCPIKAEYI